MLVRKGKLVLFIFIVVISMLNFFFQSIYSFAIWSDCFIFLNDFEDWYPVFNSQWLLQGSKNLILSVIIKVKNKNRTVTFHCLLRNIGLFHVLVLSTTPLLPPTLEHSSSLLIYLRCYILSFLKDTDDLFHCFFLSILILELQVYSS